MTCHHKTDEEKISNHGIISHDILTLHANELIRASSMHLMYKLAKAVTWTQDTYQS